MKISFKAQVKTSRKLTPKILLEKIQTGGFFPNYSHDFANDKVLCELRLLANRYRQSLSIEDKAKLLNHERGMLYEELEHPELTLARNYAKIKDMGLTKEDKKDILAHLYSFNAMALSRIESLSEPFDTNVSSEKIKVLEDLCKKVANNDSVFDSTKEELAETCSLLKTYLAIKNDDTFDDDIEKDKIEIGLDTRDFETLQEFFVNTELNTQEVEFAKELISNILSDKNTEPEVLNCAIWAGGKYKNDEIFEKIKQIASDKNESDVRKKELAIHSVSMYAREKFEEVKSILVDIILNDESELVPLAAIIYNKLHGKHYNRTDREICALSDEEKLEFKNLRDKFVIYDKDLSPRKINAIDRGLYPFRKALNHFVKDLSNNVYILAEDSYTCLKPSRAGERSFSMGKGNDGSFYDSFFGVSTKEHTVIPKEIEDDTQYNTIAHECAHLLHRSLPQEIKEEIEYLYRKAIEENRALDYYAAINSSEYFAQGFEAYVSIYKPHKYLMDNNAFDNTLYKLMDKDPELYELIEYIVDNMK